MNAESPFLNSLKIPNNYQIFKGFFLLSISAFGGVLPLARRALVYRYNWITEEEFFDLIGLCQLLPGPNVINLAVILGNRFQKIPGIFSAILGLLCAPMAISIGLAYLYSLYADSLVIKNLLKGIAPVICGLTLALASQMIKPLVKNYQEPNKNKSLTPFIYLILTFIGIGIYRYSLFKVFIILFPFSLITTYWVSRK